MSVFDELEALFNEIDNRYSSIEFEARTKGWSKKEQQYQSKRELIISYFLLVSQYKYMHRQMYSC